MMYDLNSMFYMNMIMQQMMLQQQLIMMQQKVIELQQRIDKMTPKNAPDNEVIWHIASGGMMSDEAANSDDLETVQKFQQWLVDFAKQHIKPHVSHKVYGECLNQMTRGLSHRITELEMEQYRQKLGLPELSLAARKDQYHVNG